MTCRTLVSIIALALVAQADLHAQFSWRHLTDLQEGRNFFGAVGIGGGKVLVMGGYRQGGFGEPGGQIMIPTASSEIIDAKTGATTSAGGVMKIVKEQQRSISRLDIPSR